MWRRDLIWQPEKIETSINVNCSKFPFNSCADVVNRLEQDIFILQKGFSVRVTKYVHMQNLPLLKQSGVSDIL